jgi:diguanylate cyclase (GGDEF)-like protein
MFWFAQRYDVFEYIVMQSRAHEEWELDELLTLLMISAFAMVFITLSNAKHLKKEIVKRIAAEKKIKKLAFFDGLTGLPNRELCTNRLAHILNHSARTNELAAVLFIDLDNFKEINDTYGHDAGDSVLKQVAERLSKKIRVSDTLARFAGDEFIIIIESVESVDKVVPLANKILSCTQQPFLVCNSEAQVGMSIGIALSPLDGNTVERLFNHADTAMYYAKKHGKNSFQLFSDDLELHVKNRLKIATQLRKAISNNEFTLFYQPIFDNSTFEVKGVEALLRWHNKLLGQVSPKEFIPIAEEIGIIKSIGEWVLRHACQQVKAWQQAGYQHFVVSVNMSAKELIANNYVDSVKLALEDNELAAKYLELELTETTVMKDVDTALKRLAQLKQLGVSIALDDFGTGYSSMSYLQKLKISRVKIDREFIRRIPKNSNDMVMVKAIISLAKNLNLNVTVEGIESAAQKEFLKMISVDALQGFYLAIPMSAEDFEQQYLKK